LAYIGEDIRLLYEASADSNAGISDGGSPLCKVNTLHKVEAVEPLLKCGANINIITITGSTALELLGEREDRSWRHRASRRHRAATMPE
jgi:hypothetical protein